MNMQLISKLNKRFQLLVCVIDNQNKYAWICPLKDKSGITITNIFPKKINEPGCTTHKMWAGRNS